MPPIDLNTTEADTKAFAAMAAGEALEAPAATPEPTPEPAPEPAPQPEPKPEPAKAADPEPAKAADEGEKGAGRNVPLPVLLEERGKRKGVEEQLRAAQEELAKLRGNPQPPKVEQKPTPETDPIAVIQELSREVEGLKGQEKQVREMQAFQQTVISKEAEYVKENPDYPKQVEYLKEARVRELREGLGLNDQQIAAALAQEAADTARYALNMDLNPAEVFARLAIAKGWKAPAADPKPDPKPAVEKLATIAAGQKVAKSLSSGGGGAPEAAITLESIASMSGAEFDQMWKSGKIKSLMG